MRTSLENVSSKMLDSESNSAMLLDRAKSPEIFY